MALKQLSAMQQLLLTQAWDVIFDTTHLCFAATVEISSLQANWTSTLLCPNFTLLKRLDALHEKYTIVWV